MKLSFIKLLIESSEDNLKAYSKFIEHKYGLTKFELDYLTNNDGSKDILLAIFIVPEEKRSSGIGSQVMNELCKYADNKNKIVYLYPALKHMGMGTTSRARLIKFYQRFGFKVHRSNGITMYRLPKGNK